MKKTPSPVISKITRDDVDRGTTLFQNSSSVLHSYMCNLLLHGHPA